MLTNEEAELLTDLIRNEFDTKRKYCLKNTVLTHREKCDMLISILKKTGVADMMNNHKLIMERLEEMQSDYICDFVYKKI